MFAYSFISLEDFISMTICGSAGWHNNFKGIFLNWFLKHLSFTSPPAMCRASGFSLFSKYLLPVYFSHSNGWKLEFLCGYSNFLYLSCLQLCISLVRVSFSMWLFITTLYNYLVLFILFCGSGDQVFCHWAWLCHHWFLRVLHILV